MNAAQLMKDNPYRTALLFFAGFIGAIGIACGLTGLNGQGQPGTSEEEVAAELAFAAWFLSASAIAFFLWLAVSAMSWVVIHSRRSEGEQ